MCLLCCVRIDIFFLDVFVCFGLASWAQVVVYSSLLISIPAGMGYWFVVLGCWGFRQNHKQNPYLKNS